MKELCINFLRTANDAIQESFNKLPNIGTQFDLEWACKKARTPVYEAVDCKNNFPDNVNAVLTDHLTQVHDLALQTDCKNVNSAYKYINDGAGILKNAMDYLKNPQQKDSAWGPYEYAQLALVGLAVCGAAYVIYDKYTRGTTSSKRAENIEHDKHI